MSAPPPVNQTGLPKAPTTTTPADPDTATNFWSNPDNIWALTCVGIWTISLLTSYTNIGKTPNRLVQTACAIFSILFLYMWHLKLSPQQAYSKFLSPLLKFGDSKSADSTPTVAARKP